MQQLLYTKQNVRVRAGSLLITNVVISGCNPEQMGISGVHRQHGYGDEGDDAGRFAIQAVRPNKFAGRWILEIVQNGITIWTGPPLEVGKASSFSCNVHMLTESAKDPSKFCPLGMIGPQPSRFGTVRTTDCGMLVAQVQNDAIGLCNRSANAS